MDKLLIGDFEVKHQVGKVTFHKKKDLPDNFTEWNANIEDEIGRLKKIINNV